MLKNPVVEGSGQPFRGGQRVILERRTNDGALCFDGPYPPSEPMTFDEVYDLFFRAVKEGEGSWVNLRAWLESKSWTVRPCTWA